MSDKAMREVYQLIEEERYREAREILETEDVDAEVRDKWLRWMHDLHHEERVMAGVRSDKAKANSQRVHQSQEELGGFVGGTLMAATASIMTVLLISAVFTTPSIVLAAWTLAVGVVIGLVGWLRLGNLIHAVHGNMIAVFVFMFLMIYILSSGLPMMHYYQVPVNYVAAMSLLLLPGVGGISWDAGTWLGIRAAHILREIRG